MKYAPSFKEHIHRYAFATYYAWKRDTLDAGSKEGFGAQILSWVAKSVTLTDIQQEWLDKARRVGGYMCKTDYALVDYETSFPEGQWDTVVAFEIIEHLEHPEVFLENVAKHLRKEGRLVFSVPHMVANDEHKHLYDAEKIKSLVSKYLNITEFYTQDKEYMQQTPMYKGLVCYVGVAKKP